MTRHRAEDLAGRTLSVEPRHQYENPRRPWTHGWLAFEVLRRSPRGTLRFEEYERRLFDPSAEIAELARRIPGVPNAYQDVKHIRCDIARGTVRVTPDLPADWFRVRRCSGTGQG
jgi:hypothetical protein